MADIDDPVLKEYLNSEDINMAIASDIAYSHAKNIDSGISKQEANAKTDTEIEERLNFHDLVPQYSNRHVVTIKNVMNDDYIMAVRGTKITDVSDLASDFQIAFNQEANRTKSVEKLYKSFRQDQPKAKLTLTGHSLGAYVAHNIANKNNEKYVGFDLPASPIGLVTDAVEGYGVKAEHRVYLTDHVDILSSLNKLTNFNDKVNVLPQKESTGSYIGSHNIKNYLYDKTPNSKIVKTTSKNNTHYSMPHMVTAQRTAMSVPPKKMLDTSKSVPRVVDFFKEPKKPQGLRTGYENECLKNPKLKKCKQLNESKFY